MYAYGNSVEICLKNAEILYSIIELRCEINAIGVIMQTLFDKKELKKIEMN